uniref:Uncharacterized protein n=1 Tax=Rhodococcus erythropolis TaxID=1833 RepID=Q6XMT4_RHOER|nr:hypothetical protein PBD2.212 [Rhodococcus erythropolis]
MLMEWGPGRVWRFGPRRVGGWCRGLDASLGLCVRWRVWGCCVLWSGVMACPGVGPAGVGGAVGMRFDAVFGGFLKCFVVQ